MCLRTVVGIKQDAIKCLVQILALPHSSLPSLSPAAIAPSCPVCVSPASWSLACLLLFFLPTPLGVSSVKSSPGQEHVRGPSFASPQSSVLPPHDIGHAVPPPFVWVSVPPSHSELLEDRASSVCPIYGPMWKPVNVWRERTERCSRATLRAVTMSHLQ